MAVTRIHRTIQNARRYGEIIEVLARQGFQDIVAETGLDRWLEAGRRLILRSTPAPAAQRSRAERLREAMEELGPTFIKLGQVLSVRPDLIPEDWAEEFRKLQADAAKVPFEEIRAVLASEFGEKLGGVIRHVEEEPLAAASMAQVHRATLADGTGVVLKILRPGIEEVTASDMEILSTLAEFAEAHFSNLGYSPKEVVQEFARELKKEVDLTHEGRATDRLRSYFEKDEQVRFPRVYWEASTRRVLALEEFRGVLLSSPGAKTLTGDERSRVVRSGADAVLRQCLEFGFFHADPHPGNLFALPGGVVGFIDCGMTGQLDPRTAESLALLVVGVVHADVEKVVKVVGVLADADAGVLENRAFRADVRDFVSHFENVQIGQLDMPRLLEEFFQKLRAHNLRCPGDLVLLIKALTTIQSVAKDLDPSFDMVGFATPHVERLVARRYSLSSMRRRFEASAAEYVQLAEELPGEVGQLVRQLRRNKLAINLEHRGLSRLTQTIEHASRNIAFAMTIAGLVVGSAILVHAHREGTAISFRLVGTLGLVLAGVLSLGYVVMNRRWIREKKKP
jgi:ubiquinone biosynthesis protein